MHESNWYYDRVMAYNRLYQGDIVRGGWQMRIAPYNVYWPIPQNSIDANTGNIINQNKGYHGAEKNITPKTEVTVDD
jgi:starch-binding outer membrane protein, SusD/RagB family